MIVRELKVENKWLMCDVIFTNVLARKLKKKLEESNELNEFFLIEIER